MASKRKRNKAVVEQTEYEAYRAFSTWCIEKVYTERRVLGVLALLNAIGIFIQVMWVLYLAFVPAAEETNFMELQIILGIIHIFWNFVMMGVATH